MMHYMSAFLYFIITIIIIYEHVYLSKIETAKSMKAVIHENEEYKLMYSYIIHHK